VRASIRTSARPALGQLAQQGGQLVALERLDLRADAVLSQDGDGVLSVRSPSGLWQSSWWVIAESQRFQRLLSGADMAALPHSAITRSHAGLQTTSDWYSDYDELE
jgi:hypothetical protein